MVLVIFPQRSHLPVWKPRWGARCEPLSHDQESFADVDPAFRAALGVALTLGQAIPQRERVQVEVVPLREAHK